VATAAAYLWYLVRKWPDPITYTQYLDDERAAREKIAASGGKVAPDVRHGTARVSVGGAREERL
jgi:hypothetical protein